MPRVTDGEQAGESNEANETKGRDCMERTMQVRLNGIPTARRATEAATKMSAFHAQVLLRGGDMTVNAKSLMGLVSLKLQDGMTVTIIANGEDEAQAVEMMSRLLGG